MPKSFDYSPAYSVGHFYFNTEFLIINEKIQLKIIAVFLNLYGCIFLQIQQ